MFELDRTFSQYNAKTGLTEWYFNAREGVCGPYPTKKKAAEELKAFIELRMLLKDDGGRSSGETKLTLEPMNFADMNRPNKRHDPDDLL